MADRKLSKQMWIPLMIGFVFAGLAFWLSSGYEAGRPAGHRLIAPSGQDAESAQSIVGGADGANENAVPILRMAVGRRLTIAEQDLPREGVLSLALEVSEEARGIGRRKVRIVSETAGRLDTEATPLPGAEAGLRLEIGRDFLAPGLYMIEIETVDAHPLQFRRFVLEIE